MNTTINQNLSRSVDLTKNLGTSNSDVVVRQSWEMAREQMDAVDLLIHRYTQAPGILGKAVRFHLASGGKRWRPMFLLAVGEALGCPRPAIRHLAAATELLHNASLVHDDLQDRDQMRRGRESIWYRFGENTAINLGDYLITSTYLALAEMKSSGDTARKLIGHFAAATHQVIAGQSAEIEATRKPSVTVAQYRRIARGKSGVLMALPVEGALMIAQADKGTIAHARRAMQSLGLAYQIKDDLDDLLGRKDGRKAGGDLREGRMSLPNLLFYADASGPARDAFNAFLKTSQASSDTELSYWLDRIRSSEAPARCGEEFNRAVEDALQHIDALPALLGRVLHQGKEMLLEVRESS